MKILHFAFFGLILGFVFSQLAGLSVWLEMRVNTGLLLPLSAVGAAVAGGWVSRRLPVLPVLVLEIVFAALIWINSGFDFQALLVVPAATFREGFFLRALDVRIVNLILVALLLAGNLQFLLAKRAGQDR